MNDEFNEINDKINILEVLNKYEIEFGILQEDETKTVTVNVLNTDETVTETEMTIGDIMYFTEKGTLTIPARPVLDKCLLWVNGQLNAIIDEIVTGVFEFGWTEAHIDTKMFEFGLRIQDQVKTQLRNIIQSNAALSQLIDSDDENKYLYNLNNLSNYIKCKIIKK